MKLSRPWTKPRACLALVLCSSFAPRAYAYLDGSINAALYVYLQSKSSGFPADRLAPSIYDKLDPFAGVFSGLPLDLNAGVQMLVDGGLVAAKFAGHIASDVANQAGNVLNTIDFDQTKRTIEDKSDPLDDRSVYLIGLAVALSILSATVLAAIVLHVGLPALGFTAGGVAPASIAAAWQASLGNVAAGSLFALLQSAGASGVGAYVVGSVSAAVGGLGCAAAAAAALGRQ